MSAHYVLVVEDDLDIRSMLVECIGHQGFAARGAANGADALQENRSGVAQPCVILLDLTMPVMDGWAFREAQLGDPHLASIPVVLLSAAPDIAAKAKRLQIERCLKKPLDLDDLFRAVRENCAPSTARA